MKISKYSFLQILITLLIFTIPFFWLKPGEMDLGGDNSRLYFYDPIAYLISQSLYSISHSGFGGENLSYFGIPFLLLLALVKFFFQSPTLLISVFHGLNLSLGYVSCYLIVKEFIKREEHISRKLVIIEAASIIAGLYYTFSVTPIGGWTYPLMSMNLVFLNPLLFFLTLRFLLTNSFRYMFGALLITFFFAPNFGFIGAPTFFAFFPLAILFLLIYIKIIKKKPIPLLKIFVGLLFFICLQLFHLFPQIMSILTPGSVANQTVFGDFGKFEWGLKYFLGTASIIKVSNSFMGLPQFGKFEFFFPLYIIFPFIFVGAFLWNKSKLYLLTAIFFLIIFFLVTANITSIGFKLYALAFRLPGFSMFRVFYGQWAWAYLFFYSIFLGLATAIVLEKLKTVHRYLIIGFIVLLFSLTSWPFVSGKLTDTKLWQSKDIKSHIKMDPQYDDVLSYIRSLPIDGKILSLPFNDHGYQVLKGANEAAYIGPSTITYLAARNEFTSNVELGAFGPKLLAVARAENFTMFRDILSALNIKYIFYNEDPFIYLDNFPALPYTEVRNFFPDTQDGYKEFIKKLGVREIKRFGTKYHVYEFDDTFYTPHIYTAKEIAYWNDDIAADVHTPMSFYPDDKRIALVDSSIVFDSQRELFDMLFFKARNISDIFNFFTKKKLDKFVSPTISRKFSSLIYPLVVFREKRDLNKYTIVDDVYIDRSIYFAEKRVNELYEIKNIPLLRKVISISDLSKQWREPSLWEFSRFGEYNSWEITLARYQQAMERLIHDIDTTNNSIYSSTTSKVELKAYLKEHKVKLRTAIRQDSSLMQEDISYLSGLIEGMFVDIYNYLNLNLPDLLNIPYVIQNPLPNGQYEVYVNKEDVNNLNISLSIDGKQLSSAAVSALNEWMRFEDITVQNKQTLPITLSFDEIPNLVKETNWATPEQITGAKEQTMVENDSVTLAIKYNSLADTSGIVRDISGWEGETIYAITFDYLTNDHNFSMVLHEKGGTKTHRYTNEAYDETLRSKDWKKFSVAILSAKDADFASLQFTKALDDVTVNDTSKMKVIEIKNLSVQKINNPKIVLKSVSKQVVTLPKIKFTQINPTKYQVEVRDAKSPYALVLSQSLNQKWKVFFSSKSHKAKTVKGALSRLTGFFLGSITDLLLPKQVEDNTVVASYANGTIEEGKHRSNFWDRDTFETWGLDPIAEKTHVPVNGYANSWYIYPEDVNNLTNYTLIIEMSAQKQFIGSLLISVGTFLMVLMLFIKSFIVPHK